MVDPSTRSGSTADGFGRVINGSAGRAYDDAVAGARRSPVSGGGVMVAVVMVVFLVAVVFAANANDVIGWIVALIAAGWLVLAVVVYRGVRKAARFGATQLATANDTLRSAAGLAPSGSTVGGGGTRVVTEDPGARGADPMRDEKLAHSLRIVQVQGKVVEEHLGTDPDQVARALETIQITAHNALGMLGRNGKAADDGRDGKGRPDDGPISGTVVG